MKTPDRKKAEKKASLPYYEDDARTDVEKEAVGKLLKNIGSDPSMIEAAKEAKSNPATRLDKRVRVFVHGEDYAYEMKNFGKPLKEPPILRELASIEAAIGRNREGRIYSKLKKEDYVHTLETFYKDSLGKLKRQREALVAKGGGLSVGHLASLDGHIAAMEKGLAGARSRLGKLDEHKLRKQVYEAAFSAVLLEDMNILNDPVFTKSGSAVYVEFLKHYVKRTAENLYSKIRRAEKFGELEAKAEAGRAEKRKLFEEDLLGKLRKEPGRFASAVGKVMFDHDRLETYKESDACRAALGKNYVYKLIKHGKGKHEIAGSERSLYSIFEGFHGLDENEFRGKFGETKARVAQSIGERFYREDIPALYKQYEGDLKKVVEKMAEEDLRERFSGGASYREMLGEKSPDELRAELKAGADRYMERIDHVSSLFSEEDRKIAAEVIRMQDEKLSRPITQHEKDKYIEELKIMGLRKLKSEKSGREVEGFIKKYCKES